MTTTDLWGHGFCLWNAAYALLNVGDEDVALTLFSEMHEMASARGYGILDMVGCQLLGEIWESRGVSTLFGRDGVVAGR